MIRRRSALLAALWLTLAAGPVVAHEGEPIRLAEAPALSPDGETLAFAWRGDLWRAPARGGVATRLTIHPAEDGSPVFSPDGGRLAFTSDRTGSLQVHVLEMATGETEQVTFHSEGSAVHDWVPDGTGLLISGSRDHFWRASRRFFVRRLDGPSPDALLFDDYGGAGQLSRDGRRLLFTREGTPWWRKGYVGSQASQVWFLEIAERGFRRLTQGAHEERWPLWLPDGRHVLLVSQETGTNNLFRVDLDTGERTQLTFFEEDGVHFPAVARDGSAVAFRRLFDLYRLDLAAGGEPVPINLTCGGEPVLAEIRHETLTKADRVAFSEDGREIAFLAGGDLWVMDTELREPRRVTATPEEERDCVFAPDYSAIYFVSDRGGQPDIWRAERADPALHWWQNTAFRLTRVTDDPPPESALRFLPDGRLAFLNLRGDLWSMRPDGTERRRLVGSWNEPAFDASPDGQWVAYAIEDDDFNRDVWIRRADGTGEPVNVSCHPDVDTDPVWSPDGRLLAWTGEQSHGERDIHYVWLRAADEDRTSRERKIEKALEKMKGRAKGREEKEEKKEKELKGRVESLFDFILGRKDGKKGGGGTKKPDEVVIDFEDIAERIHHIAIPDADESALLWSPDSKRLAFRAKIDGTEGLYTVAIPDDEKPKLFVKGAGEQARWLAEGDLIVWLRDGVPASVDAKGKAERYTFDALQEVALRDRNLAAFDQAWRLMRDHFYDGALNNRDWDAVRAKYRAAAAATLTAGELDTVVSLMLGELNASHLGFGARDPSAWSAPGWREVTAHLGARFDPAWTGPGLRIRDVIEGTPADRERSRLRPGEIVLSIDGVALDPGRDATALLTGPPERDLVLVVRGPDGAERKVTLRPATHDEVRGRLYEQWVKANRALVERLSEGRFGYLHVRGMGWRSFERFEAELYRIGHGRQGLVIDVRDNGGGYTTDHLLTCLTQPVHAVTVPRGGGPGYPQDRMVYARWSRPVVVLCNQNSFSNAEIFAHAIRTLRRGRIVGVPTAGGVISTGGTSILGFAWLRLPTRGWFLLGDGADMERNGCVPDVVVWPAPEELAAGRDRQLEEAVRLLEEDVAAAQANPLPSPVPASVR